jgi:hypothetical protein
MSLEDAERYATTMISLTTQARGVVRDLDPKVSSLQITLLQFTMANSYVDLCLE